LGAFAAADEAKTARTSTVKDTVKIFAICRFFSNMVTSFWLQLLSEITCNGTMFQTDEESITLMLSLS
jgi:hypothetical protein